ncbi:MAG: hypothetical protein ACLFVA_06410 [Dehalococcoidia bacterium]
MDDEALRSEAGKLVNYVLSLGNDFRILAAQSQTHIGAIIADAVLQVGHRWETHVGPRVERIKAIYPQAGTIPGLLRLLQQKGPQELLNWRGADEQDRLQKTADFFHKEEVETVGDLRAWLESDDNRDRLLTKSLRNDKADIPRIGDKTADYYRVLVGLPDAVAIDRRIADFLRDADVRRGRSQYLKARAIVQLAAPMLSTIRNQQVRPVDLDVSIWEFQSSGRTLRHRQNRSTGEQRRSNKATCVSEERASKEIDVNNVIGYSPLPARGRAIVEAKNNDSWQDAKREILISRPWMAALICWGGALDISMARMKYGASVSKMPGKRPYMWIPVWLWIGGTRYEGRLRYDLIREGGCISNHLNDRKDGLGGAMTGAGFAAKERIHLRFVGNEVWVLKSE